MFIYFDFFHIFSQEKKENFSSLSSAEFAQSDKGYSVVKKLKYKGIIRVLEHFVKMNCLFVVSFYCKIVAQRFYY